MSLGINLFSQQLNARRASDSEFGMQSTTNKMFNQIGQIGRSPGFGMNNLKQLHEQDKNNQTQMLNLSLLRKISLAMQESAENRAKENAKSFNIFA